MAWNMNAPYMNEAGLNLLVCDLAAATTAVTVVVPVTRVYAGAKAADLSGGKLKASHRTKPDGMSGDGGSMHLWA